MFLGLYFTSINGLFVGFPQFLLFWESFSVFLFFVNDIDPTVLQSTKCLVYGEVRPFWLEEIKTLSGPVLAPGTIHLSVPGDCFFLRHFSFLSCWPYKWAGCYLGKDSVEPYTDVWSSFSMWFCCLENSSNFGLPELWSMTA